MGIGSSRGADRAIKAAELAVASPLLEASIDGAHGVLLSIQGGSNLGIFEINDAARLVQEAVHPEANIIFGAVIDDTLGDEVRVTVIAAGFDGGEPNAGAKQALDSRRTTFVEAGSDEGAALASTAALDAEDIPSPSTDAWAAAESPVTETAPKDPAFDDENDDLDIPDFLK
jgi:cell division protein FtsZ